MDANPTSYGFGIADAHAVVSTRDVEAVVAFCRGYARKFPVLGVTTMGSDIPDVLAKVCAALDVPAVSERSAALATHKYSMKNRLRECNVPVPWFRYVANVAELVGCARARDHQIVIKPVDSSGSRGVFFPRPEDDLEVLFSQSRAAARCGSVIVEEYVPGVQVSTESIIWDDRSWTTGMARRNYDMLECTRPWIVENGGEQPGLFSREAQERCAALTVRAARALGLQRGVVKGDLVLHPDRGPLVIEVALRLSGGHFADALVPIATGVNIIDAVVDIAVGDAPQDEAFEPTHERVGVLRYFFPKPGTLREIRGLGGALDCAGLRLLETYLACGAVVRKPRHHGMRAGAFLVEGRDHVEALARAAEVANLVDFVTEHGNE
ncbi:ATP-grasp domain-containing protein [Planctomycetota bacterium]